MSPSTTTPHGDNAATEVAFGGASAQVIAKCDFPRVSHRVVDTLLQHVGNRLAQAALDLCSVAVYVAQPERQEVVGDTVRATPGSCRILCDWHDALDKLQLDEPVKRFGAHGVFDLAVLGSSGGNCAQHLFAQSSQIGFGRENQLSFREQRRARPAEEPQQVRLDRLVLVPPRKVQRCPAEQPPDERASLGADAWQHQRRLVRHEWYGSTYSVIDSTCVVRSTGSGRSPRKTDPCPGIRVRYTWRTAILGHNSKAREPLKRKVNVGLGFMTGRKSFKNVLRTYVDSWNESRQSAPAQDVALHLFVAYDLTYSNTEVADYAVTDDKVIRAVASAHYITGSSMRTEAQGLVKRKILTSKEAKLLFGGQGYGAKRNAILYLAVKDNLDYLIFLDDDEYPLATIRIGDRDFWTGQPVIATHLKYLSDSDITQGHHCGYVSPIPQFEWNDQLSKNDFRLFIEAISNDILNWDSIEELMGSRGVTYADRSIIEATQAEEIPETDGMKFISGSNLGLNLKPCSRLRPFYSPPGARGEDAFLSTSLSDRKVIRIPSYVFHDGFSCYQHLLRGVLPSTLRAVPSRDAYAARRFLRACIGWIRYKPMLTYVINRKGYEAEITKIKERLAIAVPRLCAYFGTDGFNRIPIELEHYHRHVEDHFRDFEDAKIAWAKVMASLEEPKFKFEVHPADGQERQSNESASAAADAPHVR